MTLDEARQRATLKVPEAAELLGISCRAAYTAIDAGQLPALHIGRRIVVPAPRLLALLGEDVDVNDRGRCMKCADEIRSP